MFYDPTTGHIVFAPGNGHMAKGCGPAIAGCSYCQDGTTPKKWRVTLAGIDVATCDTASTPAGVIFPCTDGPHTTHEYSISGIAGTWDVPRAPVDGFEYCLWELRVPAFATEMLYDQ